MAASDYQRVERAIAYLAEHASEQPSLEAVAAAVNLSPYHFQRLFTRWTGTTPKRFLQAITVERGKDALQRSRNLLEAAEHLGLSGTARLHDHFVHLEAVTPAEQREGGATLSINYGEHDSPFGPLFLAATARGICRAGFLDYVPLEQQLAALREQWPLAEIRPDPAATAHYASGMFCLASKPALPLSLRVAGTNFQVAVWRALLAIPEGCLLSYGDLARRIDRPGAERAVGNAVGANPVAFLIPCHRVIRESGALGGYRWGENRKRAMLCWERVRLDAESETAEVG